MTHFRKSPDDDGNPMDEEAELVDRSQIHIERPGVKDLSVRADDNTIRWRTKFKAAMKALCKSRGVPGPVPTTVMTATMKTRGMLLMWPGQAKDPRGFDVAISADGKRISTTLTEAFATLKVDLPHGISVDVPVRPFASRKYGDCLALYFNEAEFVGGRGKDAAAGKDQPNPGV